MSSLHQRKRKLPGEESGTSLISTHPRRDVSHLYCQSETLRCALDGLCVPCAYKLGCYDIAFDKEFHQKAPNQRPEMCPRLTKDGDKLSESPRIGTLGYRPGMSVLTCGDGDFSFSLAVARILFADKNKDNSLSAEDSTDVPSSVLVATSYESRDTLAEIYTNFESTIEELEVLGATVLFQVDATQLGTLRSTSSSLADQHFDRICWNFPCTAVARGQDGQNEAMEENKQLVKLFVKNAKPLLANKAEIHVCHKTKPPFNQWKLQQVVVTEDYDFVGRVVLDRATIPPYVPRKALDQKSFPCHDACFYIFRCEHHGSDCKDVSSVHPATISEGNHQVPKVTDALLDQIRSAHLVKARFNAYRGKEGRKKHKKNQQQNGSSRMSKKRKY